MRKLTQREAKPHTEVYTALVDEQEFEPKSVGNLFSQSWGMISSLLWFKGQLWTYIHTHTHTLVLSGMGGGTPTKRRSPGVGGPSPHPATLLPETPYPPASGASPLSSRKHGRHLVAIRGKRHHYQPCVRMLSARSLLPDWLRCTVMPPN